MGKTEKTREQKKRGTKGRVKKGVKKMANIKETRKRGEGVRDKRDRGRGRGSKGTYPVVLTYPVEEWRGDVECGRPLKVVTLRQIWSPYKGDSKWGRGGVLHNGVQFSDEMLAKDCISIVVPPPLPRAWRVFPFTSSAWRPPPPCLLSNENVNRWRSRCLLVRCVMQTFRALL
jgi:hypothetical protein